MVFHHNRCQNYLKYACTTNYAGPRESTDKDDRHELLGTARARSEKQVIHIHNDLARGKRPVPSKRGVNIRSEIPKYLPSGLLKKVADVLDLLGLHERGRIKKNVGDRHSY